MEKTVSEDTETPNIRRDMLQPASLPTAKTSENKNNDFYTMTFAPINAKIGDTDQSVDQHRGQVVNEHSMQGQSESIHIKMEISHNKTAHDCVHSEEKNTENNTGIGEGRHEPMITIKPEKSDDHTTEYHKVQDGNGHIDIMHASLEMAHCQTAALNNVHLEEGNSTTEVNYESVINIQPEENQVSSAEKFKSQCTSQSSQMKFPTNTLWMMNVKSRSENWEGGTGGPLSEEDSGIETSKVKSDPIITIKPEETQGYPSENNSSPVEPSCIKQEDTKPRLANYTEFSCNATMISQSSQSEPSTKTLCVVHIESPTVKWEKVTSECILCEKTCKTRGSVIDYIQQNIVPSSQWKNFWCAECREAFNSIYNAMMHAFRIHKGCTIVKKGKRIKYTCPFCLMKITVKRNFYAHLKEHQHQDYKTWQEQKHKVMEAEYNGKNKSMLEIERYLCPSCIPKASVKKFREKIPNVKEGKKQVIGVLEIGETTCPRCFREFEFKHQRDLHVMKHKRKKLKAICGQCGWAFDFSRSLRAHVQRKHLDVSKNIPRAANETNDRFNCSHCHKRFRFEYLLRVHQRSCVNREESSSGSKLLTCPYVNCHRKFTFKEAYDNHTKEHGDDMLNYKCGYKNCTFTVASYNGLRQHAFKAHADLVRCPRCCVKIWPKTTYDKHIMRCSSTFKCVKCHLKFETREELDGHMCPESPAVKPNEQEKGNQSHGAPSEPGMKIRKCLSCEEDFQYRTSVQDYITQLSSPKELKAHIICEHEVKVSDTNTTENSCSWCKRTFLNAQELKSHIICEHEWKIPDTNKTEKRCSWCKRTFSSPKELEVHIICEHEWKIPDTNLARKISDGFQCHECLQKFMNKCDALCHAYLEHTGVYVASEGKEKYYRCCICYRMIKTKTELQRHIKDHDRLEYKCLNKTCGWMFENSKELDTHACSTPSIGDLKPSQLSNLYKVRKEGVVCAKCVRPVARVPLIPSWNRKTFKYKCRECGKHFVTKWQHCRHVQAVHGFVDKKIRHIYWCRRCGREFYLQRWLQTHLKTHHNLKCKCSQCGWEFESVGALGSHLRQTHNDILSNNSVIDSKCTMMFRCKKCKCAFVDGKSLSDHELISGHGDWDIQRETLTKNSRIRLQLQKSNGEWACTESRTESSESQSMEDIVVPKEEKIYECPHCGWDYYNLNSLKTHVQTVHGKGLVEGPESNNNEVSLPSIAQVCTLKPQANLPRITEVHTLKPCTSLPRITEVRILKPCARLPKMRHTCSHCDMKFSKLNMYTEHVKLQHDIKKTQQSERCLRCKRTFSSPEELKSHIICEPVCKIPDTNEEPKGCWWCKRTFSSPGELESHIICEHVSKMPDTNETEKRCLWCKRMFSSPQELKSHIICEHEWKIRDTNLVRKISFSKFKSGRPVKKRHTVHGDSWMFTVSTKEQPSSTGPHQRPVRAAKLRKARVVLERLPDSILEKYLDNTTSNPNLLQKKFRPRVTLNLRGIPLSSWRDWKTF